MNAKAVGERLVALCSEGKNLDALDELYSADVVSVEAAKAPGMERTANGIDAVRGKNQWWIDNHEVHSSSVRGPFPHGDDRFCALFDFEVTFKPAGQRFKMEEVAHYTVKDGKIVREEFFYSM